MCHRYFEYTLVLTSLSLNIADRFIQHEVFELLQTILPYNDILSREGSVLYIFSTLPSFSPYCQRMGGANFWISITTFYLVWVKEMPPSPISPRPPSPWVRYATEARFCSKRLKEEGAHKFTIDFHLFKGGADFAIPFGRLGEFGSRLVRFVKLYVPFQSSPTFTLAGCILLLPYCE